MAFGDKVTLFGGITSTQATPPPEILGDTWEWDGKHWALRQDMGPAPRWGHGLTYDSKRKNLVLFGGLPVFAPTDATVADKLLGDTWEHEATGDTPPAPPTPPPGGGIAVQSLDLSPTSASPGTLIKATITLNKATDVPTIVGMEFFPRRLLDSPSVPPSEIKPLPDVQIPAGMLTFVTQFSSAGMTESMAIAAETAGTDAVVAILTITP
jgi:hypothetical protein